ncbi:MAG: uroporphyrinogen-III synthase [Thiohalomonadaceae bacterium]
MPNRHSLQGLRVLVTRPAHQAEGLCQRIIEQGGVPLRLPTLLIEDLGQRPEVLAALARLDQYQLLIFVSPNAVQSGLAAIQAVGGLPASLRLATVGAGSARTLHEQLGRGPDLVPGQRYDSEGLLALPALQQMAGQRVLILRGEDGRALLGESLHQRGAEVDYLAVYRRRAAALPAALDAWPQNTDIITITSGEGLRMLCQMTPPTQHHRMFGLPLVVVSTRTVELARQLGFRQTALLAERASDEAIVDRLIEWADAQGHTE